MLSGSNTEFILYFWLLDVFDEFYLGENLLWGVVKIDEEYKMPIIVWGVTTYTDVLYKMAPLCGGRKQTDRQPNMKCALQNGYLRDRESLER